MKTYINYLLNGILFLAVIGLYFKGSQSQKLAYVDNIKLLKEYEGTKKAQSALQDQIKTMSANVDSLAKELEAMLKQMEKDMATMTQKEQKLSEELFNTKQQQYANFRDVTQKKMQELDQQVTKQVLDEINAFVKQYGEDNNYEIILGASSDGNIVYAKEHLNITNQVLESLNTNYKQHN